ncbi:NUMOD3 motif (2 copies) [compost metagenome]
MSSSAKNRHGGGGGGGSGKPRPLFAVPLFPNPIPCLFTEAEINKHTGIWKRAQQQYGIPLSAETRAKISKALSGRRLSEETKMKISASLKRFHAARSR